MFEWTNCSGKDVLVAFPNDFLLAFPIRQCSHVGKMTLARLPIRHSLDNRAILSYPIWPSLACHLYESKLSDAERKAIDSFIFE